MKRFILLFLMALVAISCYEYAEMKPEKQIEPIPIEIPTFTGARRESISTECQVFYVDISTIHPSVSSATASCIRDYLGQKGVAGEYKISKKTLYGIINSISKKAFKSNNRNKVVVGERFSFRLPRTITIIRAALSNYYLTGSRAYGLDSLSKVIAVKWLKPYEINVFDCSEMSAFMEYWLERNGFNTDIVLDSTHSWTLVEVEPGNWIHVEVTGKSPSLMPRRKYNYRFKDIYDALEYFHEEYDWWKEMKPVEGVISW